MREHTMKFDLTKFGEVELAPNGKSSKGADRYQHKIAIKEDDGTRIWVTIDAYGKAPEEINTRESATFGGSANHETRRGKRSKATQGALDLSNLDPAKLAGLVQALKASGAF
jgi:hypothetical protein